VGIITVRVDETSQFLIASKKTLGFLRVWLAGKVVLGDPQVFDEQPNQIYVPFECDLAWLKTPIDNLFKEINITVDKMTKVGRPTSNNPRQSKLTRITWRFDESRFRTAYAKWMKEHPLFHPAVA
jgi:hypothetical protein